MPATLPLALAPKLRLHLGADCLQHRPSHATTSEQQATHVTLAPRHAPLTFCRNVLGHAPNAPTACPTAFCSTRTIASRVGAGSGLLCLEHSHSSDCIFSSPLPTFCCRPGPFLAPWRPWHHIRRCCPRTCAPCQAGLQPPTPPLALLWGASRYLSTGTCHGDYSPSSASGYSSTPRLNASVLPSSSYRSLITLVSSCHFSLWSSSDCMSEISTVCGQSR